MKAQKEILTKQTRKCILSAAEATIIGEIKAKTADEPKDTMHFLVSFSAAEATIVEKTKAKTPDE